MTRRVDARDVLDPNGCTRSAFAARVLGRYRRTGPNAWDDYELVPAKGEPLQVAAGIMIQVEDQEAHFRIRHRGKVLLAEWTPSDEQRAAIERHHLDPRAAFLDACVEDYASPPGIGLAALIAKKLSEDD